MILPEKSYFKISEICTLWKCSEDHIIQLAASSKLFLVADFTGYVIVDGIYKDTFLPENCKFGQTVGRLFNFDLNFNNPTAIYAPNVENKYPFQFKVPRKDQVKVYFHRALSDNDPLLLELHKHYDVNIIDSYVQMLIKLSDFDKIAISPGILSWLEQVDVKMSTGLERLRSDDIKKFITKDKIQVEYLYPSKQGYFKCIAEGKNQPLPCISRSDLYTPLEEKNRIEKNYSLGSMNQSITNAETITVLNLTDNQNELINIKVKEEISKQKAKAASSSQKNKDYKLLKKEAINCLSQLKKDKKFKSTKNAAQIIFGELTGYATSKSLTQLTETNGEETVYKWLLKHEKAIS